MDQIDLRLIELLRANGRASHEDLAKAVHLSRPAVHERIKRLERTGAIKGYTVRPDWAEVGLPVLAFIAVRMGCNQWRKTVAAFERIRVPGSVILEAHRLAGDDCFFLKVRAANTLTLQEVIDSLWKVEGVTSTKTTVALCTVIEEDLPGLTVANDVSAVKAT